MILTTTEQIPGREITEIIGIVRGNTVRARDIGRDITSAFKAMAGGELKHYTDLLTTSRDEAITRLTKEAEELGADAVVNIRFTTSNVMQGAAEILVFGTAVKLS